jgi:hypothetical protein
VVEDTWSKSILWLQVEVFVRKRPMNAKEKKSKQFDVVTTLPSKSWGARCVVHEPKKKVLRAHVHQYHSQKSCLPFWAAQRACVPDIDAATWEGCGDGPRKSTIWLHSFAQLLLQVDLDKFVQNHKFNFDMTFGEQCDNEAHPNQPVPRPSRVSSSLLLLAFIQPISLS